MMITDPQMHETPPEKAEEHPKRAEYGQKWPKMEKCDFLKILQCPDFANFFGGFWHIFLPKNVDSSDGGF